MASWLGWGWVVLEGVRYGTNAPVPPIDNLDCQIWCGGWELGLLCLFVCASEKKGGQCACLGEVSG